MPENAEAPLACHGRLKPGLRGLFAGLSGKLLLLTVVFVMLAEVLIFVPSISTMRLRWLQDRLNTAAAAGIVIDGLQVSDLPRGLQDDTLVATGTRAIVLRKDGTSRLLAASDMPDAVDGQYNLAETTSWGSICDALDTLVFGGNRIIRVYGPIGDSGTVLGGAAGYEVDAVIRSEETPKNLVRLATADDFDDSFQVRPEIWLADGDAERETLRRADMTIYRHTGGGEVFCTGSVAWIGSLPERGTNNNVGTIMKNLAERFGNWTHYRAQ